MMGNGIIYSVLGISGDFHNEDYDKDVLYAGPDIATAFSFVPKPREYHTIEVSSWLDKQRIRTEIIKDGSRNVIFDLREKLNAEIQTEEQALQLKKSELAKLNQF